MTNSKLIAENKVLRKALEMACKHYRFEHGLSEKVYRNAIIGDAKYFIRKAKEATK